MGDSLHVAWLPASRSKPLSSRWGQRRIKELSLKRFRAPQFRRLVIGTRLYKGWYMSVITPCLALICKSIAVLYSEALCTRIRNPGPPTETTPTTICIVSIAAHGPGGWPGRETQTSIIKSLNGFPSAPRVRHASRIQVLQTALYAVEFLIQRKSSNSRTCDPAAPCTDVHRVPCPGCHPAELLSQTPGLHRGQFYIPPRSDDAESGVHCSGADGNSASYSLVAG